MAQQRVVVYGGKGALGSTLVNYFKNKNWFVLSIDLGANDQASANVIVTGSTLVEQAQMVEKAVGEVLKGDKVEAILCVAGGWAGGNAANKDFVKNTDLMMKQSIWTSVISAQVAARHLKEGGLLTLAGAAPCLKGTGGMIGYGLAKAAVHQLTASLAQDNGGLPKDAVVQTILPVTLDTPMNRKFMPDADHSTWTPMPYIAEMFEKWASEASSRHPNGSLVKIITVEGKTSQEVV